MVKSARRLPNTSRAQPSHGCTPLRSTITRLRILCAVTGFGTQHIRSAASVQGAGGVSALILALQCGADPDVVMHALAIISDAVSSEAGAMLCGPATAARCHGLAALLSWHKAVVDVQTSMASRCQRSG